MLWPTAGFRFDSVNLCLSNLGPACSWTTRINRQTPLAYLPDSVPGILNSSELS